MKRLAKSIISSNLIFFLAACLVILGLNLTPTIAHLRHAPPGRTFTLIHNNAQDFFFYQSLMNEGVGGAWLTSDPYTSEPHQSSIIFSYFLWLGKLSKTFALPYSVTYHLARIILSIFFLFAVFYLLFQMKIPHPKLAFFFFLFAAPFMHRISDGGKVVSVPYMYWWTGIDPVRRAAYLPHHMFGSLFLVLSFIFLIKYLRTGNIKYIFYLIIAAVLLAFVHTPSLLILLLVIPPTIIISILTASDPKDWQIKRKYIGIAIYWIIGALFLLLMLSQTNKGFPWSQYIAWEKRLQFPLPSELAGALGILFPAAILGGIKALFSKRFEYILAFSWLFIPFLLIPLAPIFNLSNIRLIQGAPYLPLSILAVIGIETIGLAIKRVASDSKDESIAKKILYASEIANFIIIAVFLIFTIPTISWSIKDQIREYWPIFGNVYLDNRLQNAFSFISSNFPPKTITLGTFYTGNYLPAYTPTISFIGHFGYTYKIDEKQALARKFFENKMSDKEAKDLILDNKITLVWQGPEEKPIYSNYLYPNLLKPVYDKEEVTLYVLK